MRILERIQGRGRILKLDGSTLEVDYHLEVEKELIQADDRTSPEWDTQRIRGRIVPDSMLALQSFINTPASLQLSDGQQLEIVVENEEGWVAPPPNEETSQTRNP